MCRGNYQFTGKSKDTLKPSHLSLDHEAQLVRTYRQSMNGANGPTEVPAIKYIHLHECDKFSNDQAYAILAPPW
ncbi:plant cysteine oxidase [Trifolium repens]|nr:plant cysteine oxidase [Trifolium repens]